MRKKQIEVVASPYHGEEGGANPTLALKENVRK